MNNQPALNADQMEERLDEHVESVLTSRRTASEAAQHLAALTRKQQENILHWVAIVAKTNAELAYQVAYYAAQAASQLDNQGIECWVLQAVDVFDKSGLYDAIAVVKAVDTFVAQYRQKINGLSLDSVATVLQHFVRGLNGRPLAIDVGDQPYTDTETIYLPGIVNLFSQNGTNFQLYKAMAVNLWAQTWYGTTRVDWAKIGERLASQATLQHSLRLFHRLETIRLDACIGRDLPGAHREMAMLRNQLGQELVPHDWRGVCRRLLELHASEETSIELLSEIQNLPLPKGICYQGIMVPDQVNAIRQQRLENDKQQLRKALRNIVNDLGKTQNIEAEQPRSNETNTTNLEKFTLHVQRQDDFHESVQVELDLDGVPLVVPDDIKHIVNSIMQDLSEVPEDYLIPAGSGAYDAASSKDERNPDDVWRGAYHEEGAYLYNEWDHVRNHYRKNWAVLREKNGRLQSDDFAAKTLQKYSGQVAQLKRTFEAIRGEQKLLKKQIQGADVDLDAVVEAFADVKSGLELTDRLYTRMHKTERNLAAVFMVDMSGSTKGWINDAEREALILLCEALETLGDRYAIYGFSGFTRKKCELYRIKQFDEPYDEQVRSRISGISPQDYTRMGVVIRHLSKMLNDLDAKTKLLITLSDGKPDDLDGYRGEYGIEDTRQALIEAKRNGIHPFCITIDKEATDYLPHMYGAVNYTVVDDVKKLPLKVSDIYRKLTT